MHYNEMVTRKLRGYIYGLICNKIYNTAVKLNMVRRGDKLIPTWTIYVYNDDYKCIHSGRYNPKEWTTVET